MSSLRKMSRAENNRRLNDATIIKTPQEIKGCLSKIGHDTLFEAERLAAIHNQRAYKCVFCNLWHLTKKGITQ